MVKEFRFRGKTLEELQKMNLKELAQLFKSRVRRKMLRGFNEKELKFIKKVEKAKEGAFIKTHLRDMIILPTFVGKTIGVYNGKEFVAVKIRPEMIGHRLGEFSITRKVPKHSGPGIGATRSTKHVGRK
ncbi:MAG: 30S ribosomal protein S19 [Candidatus Nanohaloarchaeota archaeon]|nr:30S ribosomal protein S19 [Candidatus Nanohaloarchaeota archaeon]